MLILDHLLHLHESLIMAIPLMTHQSGVTTRDGIDLHLGQKPKLGGGTSTIHSSIYHILLVLCIYMLRFLFFLFVASCFYFCFPKHKKAKNISVVSLYFPL
jgi:hypothetical protein